MILIFFIYLTWIIIPLEKFSDNMVPEEIDGVISVEAELFDSQERVGLRSWEIIDSKINRQDLENHYQQASGDSYIKILPDTRKTHDDELIPGENFSNEPGSLGILKYRIYINNPGKYYVWVRAFSTGTEDNGIHVGINDEWPESGRRMQWCEGKNQWTWESRQRTDSVHCGVEELIFLEIEKSGYHDILFSMREDGFEFDKFVLSREYTKPVGKGPAVRWREN